MATRDNPADEIVEYGNSAQESNNKKATMLFSGLLFGAVYAHMLHLSTRSYAEHKALDELYTELPGLVDSLVESYQGKYGIVTDWPELPKNCVGFVTELKKLGDTSRGTSGYGSSGR